jgi:hypothetical protein
MHEILSLSLGNTFHKLKHAYTFKSGKEIEQNILKHKTKAEKIYSRHQSGKKRVI